MAEANDLGLKYAQALKIWVQRFQEAQNTIRGMDRQTDQIVTSYDEAIELLRQTVLERDERIAVLVRENERLKAGLPADDGSTGD